MPNKNKKEKVSRWRWGVAGQGVGAGAPRGGSGAQAPRGGGAWGSARWGAAAEPGAEGVGEMLPAAAESRVRGRPLPSPLNAGPLLPPGAGYWGGGSSRWGLVRGGGG